MGVTQYVASQFAHPRGAAAPVMAALLNAVNKKVNRAAVEAAGVAPGESVLDVGFGGGVGLELVLRAVGPRGRVLAVDPSSEMVARAKRRFRQEVESARLTAAVGEAGALPVDSATVDVAYTVNTTYFWPDLQKGLAELHRALVPAGRAVLAVQPSVIARHERFSGLRPASPHELASLCKHVGFREARVMEPARDIALVVAHA